MPSDQLPATNADVERKRSEVAISSKGFGGMLMPQSLQEVVTFAQTMSSGAIALPKHLRGEPGACLAICMQALRWEMDPFAVANKSYSVNDRLGYEAQLVNAVVITRAPIVGRPRYEYSGDGAGRKCRVVIKVVGEDEPLDYETPTLGSIPVKNSPLWKSDPDQQLGYYAIRSWARRHTPEVLLGVYTKDELEAEEPRNVTPPGGGSGLKDRLKGSTTGEGFNGAVGDVIEAEFEEKPVSFAENVETAEEVIEQVAEAADAAEAEGDVEVEEEDDLADPTSPGEPIETGSAPDAEAELDTQGSATDASTDTPAETSGPGEPAQASSDGEKTTPETSSEVAEDDPEKAFADPDILTWAAGLYRAAVKGQSTVDRLREVWNARKDELKRRNPNMWRQVNTALSDNAVRAATAKASGK